MKKIFSLLLCCLLLNGCTKPTAESTVPAHETNAATASVLVPEGSQPDQPVTEPVARFTLYTPNENADGFIATEVSGPMLTPLEALVDAGILPVEVQLNTVKWEDDMLTFDFNSAFRDLILTQGSSGERMVIGCVVNTYLSAYETDQILITVEGEILESGHVVYDFPMGFFE